MKSNLSASLRCVSENTLTAPRTEKRAASYFTQLSLGYRQLGA